MKVITTALCHDGAGGIAFRFHDGKWDIVAGPLEDGVLPPGGGYSIEDNVDRLIREQLGVEFLDLSFAGYRDQFGGSRYRIIHLDFFARIPVAGVRALEGGVLAPDSLMWATRHSLPYPMHGAFDRYLAKYRERIASEIYLLPRHEGSLARGDAQGGSCAR